VNPNGHRWFAVYTKPRQEQIALHNLERQSFECFLPQVAKSDRRRRSSRAAAYEPLFPRYLFLRADDRQQSLGTVRSTRGAVGLVTAGVELSTVPEGVIDQLKARVDPAIGLIPADTMTLARGDKVQIDEGPLGALEGVFKEHRGQTRSLLLIEMLGRQTAVEIDSRLVKKAD